MKAEIKKILFSRNKCTVADIQQLLEDKVVDVTELSAVLGRAIAEDLAGQTKKDVTQEIPQGGIYEAPDQNNLVVLWGARFSGKSSVIASLLSLKNMVPILSCESDDSSQRIKDRIRAMFTTFLKEGRYQRLLKMDSPSLETYHAKYKKGWRRYNLSFIEADIENWAEANELLKTNPRQIHIFCIDCRQDIDSQVENHKRVTERLIHAGHLQQAAGVYVMVTKADLMNAPEPYLDNAAQTLVTTSIASDFWRLIRNKCKETYIYNEQPVVCSVGDFVLADYASLKHDYTQRLCDEYIIPKCEHKHWGIGKLMKMGTKKMAAIGAMIILAALAAGVYLLYDTLTTPPTRELLPYDYEANFIAGVDRKLSQGADFDGACVAYDSLRYDLDTERGIRLKESERQLLPDSIYNRCDRSLCNAFSKILRSQMADFFKSSDWSADSSFMSNALSQLAKLEKHHENMDSENVVECQQYKNYLICYRDTIRTILALKDCCVLCDDVEKIVDLADSLVNEYPYSNDSTLNNSLSNAPYDAYRSCTDFFKKSGKDLILAYKNTEEGIIDQAVTKMVNCFNKAKEKVESIWNDLWGNKKTDEKAKKEENKTSKASQSKEEDIRNKLKESITDLKNNADSLLNNLNKYVEDQNIESEQYGKITSDLDSLIKKLNSALNNTNQ